MSIRKKKRISASVAAWPVSELAALYSSHRSALLTQARRILRNDADAAEVVQDAFLKFILAAPELDSSDRALAYLRTTVNNLSLNVIRASGSRPNLVAIDSEFSQQRLSELALEAYIPLDSTLVAAEDAVLIREALSRLSQSQRTALVMWEIEGRSTIEIARAIGTSESNVRHVVQRARASFIRILSEWVLDETSGKTALDIVAGTYKKAAEITSKSSKVALSLLIVGIAFLGLNSVSGSKLNLINTFTDQQQVSIEQPKLVLKSKSDVGLGNESLLAFKSTEKISVVNVHASKSIFAGLSKDGLPTGFSITDGYREVGAIAVSGQSTITNPDGYILVSYVRSDSDEAINFLMSQSITVDAADTSYFASPSITIAGAWFPLTQSGSASTITRLADGNYLLIATLYIDSTVDSSLFLAATGGLDVDVIPNEITTRIILDSGKSSILAQAIHLDSKGIR